MSASYEEFMESGLQRIQPHDQNNPQDCAICHGPLLMRISQLIASSGDSRPHPAVRIINCNHIHGLACLDDWLSANNTCPTCSIELFPPRNTQSSSDEGEEEVEVEERRFLDEVFDDDDKDDEDWELSSEEEDDEEYEEDEDEDTEQLEEVQELAEEYEGEEEEEMEEREDMDGDMSNTHRRKRVRFDFGMDID